MIMLQNIFVQKSNVRLFVRDVLQCGCPEDVFDDIRIGLPTLYNTHNVAGGLEILIGRRLLVTVIPFDNVGNPDTEIQPILNQGRLVRDDNGFNRFRLVLVGVKDPKRREELLALADTLEERIHIHLLEESDLQVAKSG